MKFRHITLLIAFSLTFQVAKAQSISSAKNYEKQSWQLADPDSGHYTGTATNSAYKLLEGKTSTPIIVAVIDGGTDTAHADLQPNLWTNQREIPGNGIDDEGNGYADDIHGWNFIGGKSGNINQENIEETRLYKLGKDKLPAQYNWKKIKKAYLSQKKTALKQQKLVTKLNDMAIGIKASAKDTVVTAEDVRNYKAKGLKFKFIKNAVASAMERGTDWNYFADALADGKEQLDAVVNYQLNPDFNPRSIVGDDPNNMNEKNYGNNDVTGPFSLHGTHVAGIIAAVRLNGLGMDGIADNAKIMIVRVVPNGDERDKDVANGIRYAVDNGAKLINMSFGKDYSPNKEVVSAAIKYAEAKNVLIFHGAGNESRSNDDNVNFPSQILDDKTRAKNWIEVGASDYEGKAADFSNFGKLNVDLFAPGVQIYSTVSNNEYKFEDGTSMASPVACGVGALLWSYFPTLTMQQIREIILSSVYKKDTDTPLPSKRKEIVKFDTLSVSGGIIDAEMAVKRAMEMTK